MNKILLLVTFLTIFGLNVFAQQKIYEPKKGSAERAALMDAIRAYDTARDPQLKTEIFEITALRIQGNWSYANIVQKLPDGVQSYDAAHVFLQKTGGKWRVAFSTYNDTNEVGVDGLEKLKKKNKTFPKQLAAFAMNYLAG